MACAVDAAAVEKIAKLFAMTGSPNPNEAATANEKLDALLKAHGLNRSDVANLIQAGGGKQTPTAAEREAGARYYEQWSEQTREEANAQSNRQRDDELRRNASYRAEVIAKYGSEQAAREPCERERKLIVATAHSMLMSGSKQALGGWDGRGSPPWDVTKVVMEAYPMPSTITEAKEEFAYWTVRNRELAAIDCCPGEVALSLPCQARQHAVKSYLESSLTASSLDEVAIRMDFLLRDECSRSKRDINMALLHDIIGLKQKTTAKEPKRSRAEKAIAITEALKASPAASDREIARRVGASAPTVGVFRKKLGLDQEVRSVVRAGKEQTMRISGLANRRPE